MPTEALDTILTEAVRDVLIVATRALYVYLQMQMCSTCRGSTCCTHKSSNYFFTEALHAVMVVRAVLTETVHAVLTKAVRTVHTEAVQCTTYCTLQKAVRGLLKEEAGHEVLTEAGQ